MTFSDRMKFAMNRAGHTQGSLAKAVGMAQSSVWKLTSGDAKGSRRIVEIARVLNVRPEWLAEGVDPMDVDPPLSKDSTESSIPPENEWGGVSPWDSKTPLDEDEVEVPFLKDIEFACGTGKTSDADYNGFKIRFSKATLRRVSANTDGSSVICFPASGNSMEPVISDGATIAVNIDDKRIIDGKLYAVDEGGWKRIKMLYRVGPDRISLRSYNKEEHPDEEKNFSDIGIIGRVFWWSVLDYLL